MEGPGLDIYLLHEEKKLKSSSLKVGILTSEFDGGFPRNTRLSTFRLMGSK